VARKKQSGAIDATEIGRVARPVMSKTTVPLAAVPTFDRRHTTKIRFGRFSSEVFAKERLKEILVDPDAMINV